MELRQYISVIRRYLWLILLTTALAGGTAFYVSYTALQNYRATVTLQIDPGVDPLSDPLAVSGARTVATAAEIFAAKIMSPPFLREVQARLGLQGMDIKEMINVQQVSDTQFLHISAESTNPELAAALADTVAQLFIERETAQQQARFQAGLTEIEAQIEALETSIAATQREIAMLGNPEDDPSEFVRLERSRLESQLTRDQTRLVVLLSSAEEFRLAMARYIDNITIYAPAEITPIPSRTTQNTLLGGLAGLMVGVALTFLLEYLDDTLKSPDDVKQSLSVNVLGMIPRLKELDGQHSLAVTEYPLQPIAEAFRNLRTSLQFSSVDAPAKTFLITSPLPTDGKTFTAANLAAVMAQGGKRVILVDADLRHPTLHRIFGLSKEPGLTTALLAPEEREQVVRATEVQGLRIVTSGATPPNPAELLASDRMRAFTDWLADEADAVIFDSPPVLAVTDAAVLSHLVKGTLLVVDCGETRRPAAVQAAERLASVGANLMGVVLNRMSPNGGGYYYYYYHYYSGAEGKARRRRSRRSWLSRLLRPGHAGRRKAGRASE